MSLPNSNDFYQSVSSSRSSGESYKSSSGSDAEPEYISIPPPPLPPPAEDPPPDVDAAALRRNVAPVRGGNQKSFIVYHTANGKVTHYLTTGKYEAVCSVDGHGRCNMTRSARSPKGRRKEYRRHQGRPAAGMVAWLEGVDNTMLSAPAHKLFKPSFQKRRDTRTVLQGSEVGRDLLKPERKKKDFEPDSEPSDWDAV